ncbi:hypothetical protein WICPIJ_007866 [Wickerhamomyces pijperi]|uniref:GINS subunit domain-containing protein n=1 Tax=Wickerhamomyces pijperi TaxID=599730 RepID=A0A9P8TK14_WICPI|nr:hypothetical protein WICPIJ_007866 [Wickerhamomyces pijperi]
MDFSDIFAEFDQSKRASRHDNSQESHNDLVLLQQAWSNERLSPEILEYEHDLLERILGKLKQKIEFVELNSMEIQSSHNDIKITLMIIESEIERVSFLIRSYLRTRLSKIDKYTMFIMNSEDSVMKLSEEETIYMDSHLRSLTKLYNNLFLKHFDESLQKLDETGGGASMIDEPDLQKPVFIQVVETIEDPIRFGDDENDLVRLEKGIAAEVSELWWSKSESSVNLFNEELDSAFVIEGRGAIGGRLGGEGFRNELIPILDVSSFESNGAGVDVGVGDGLLLYSSDGFKRLVIEKGFCFLLFTSSSGLAAEI